MTTIPNLILMITVLIGAVYIGHAIYHAIAAMVEPMNMRGLFRRLAPIFARRQAGGAVSEGGTPGTGCDDVASLIPVVSFPLGGAPDAAVVGTTSSAPPRPFPPFLREAAAERAIRRLEALEIAAREATFAEPDPEFDGFGAKPTYDHTVAAARRYIVGQDGTRYVSSHDDLPARPRRHSR